MEKYLTDNGIIVNGIEKTSHPQSKFTSFKITIFKPDLHFFDDNFWPNGVYCKIWYERIDQNNGANDNGVQNGSY